jgi:hypothetical protein
LALSIQRNGAKKLSPMAVQDQQPNQGNPDKSRLIILAIVALCLALLLAQKFGCGPVQTEDKIEWIDR